MKRSARGFTRSARGFTLLELLIAVSLLSVLAVLSWRGMESVLRGRDAIVERSDDLRALTIAMAQMEEDLRRSWPVRLLDLAVPAVGFLPGDDRQPPALAVLRESYLDGPMQVQQVIWRLRQGVLERGFRAWPMPREGASPPDVPFTWQAIVTGVEAIEFRGWSSGRGWQPAAALAVSLPQEMASDLAADSGASPRVSTTPGGQPSGQPSGPPPASPAVQNRAPLVTGVQMVLVRHGERIVRVFAVAD